MVAASETILFFTADDGIHGRELWRSDGALGYLDPRPDLAFPASGGAGTHLVKDARLGAHGSEPLYLTWEETLGLLFLSANDGSSGRELWSSDGTAAGTSMVADICPGTRSSMPSHLTAWEGKVFFQADDCTAGPEMWVTDGTSAGTVLVADVRPGSAGGYPSFFTPLNSPSSGGGERLFFFANGGGYDAAYPSGVAQGWGGAQLWLSDGTRDGTRRAFEQRTAGDIFPDRESLLAGRPARMAVFDGALYLPATQDPLVAVEHLTGMNDTTRDGISQVRAFKNRKRAHHNFFCCRFALLTRVHSASS